MSRKIPVIDLNDWSCGEPERMSKFSQEMGDALKDIGFFALTGHDIPLELITDAYSISSDFFGRSSALKAGYEKSEIHRQRGFTSFGTEHAKNNSAPDLKEFWQTGRTLPENHHAFDEFPQNIWPDDLVPEFRGIIDGLYNQMEALANTLLRIAAVYLGKHEDWFVDMAEDGNTILRVIHYPPIRPNDPPGAVRSAQHEDINFITLLVGSTADGLEVQDHDGTWIKVEGNHEHIIVDSGDMIQNLTNGLFKSTTHRVVNPPDDFSDRYSMPMFVHPRNDVDLSPRPEFVEMTGGEVAYPPISAGEYLHQRLKEIGLAD